RSTVKMIRVDVRWPLEGRRIAAGPGVEPQKAHGERPIVVDQGRRRAPVREGVAAGQEARIFLGDIVGGGGDVLGIRGKAADYERTFKLVPDILQREGIAGF